MDLTPYLDELRDSLLSASSIGDDATRRSAQALAAALEPAARLAMLHALSDLAAEVTRQLADTGGDAGEEIEVDVRLDGRNIRVATTRRWEHSGSTASAAGGRFTADAGSSADSDTSAASGDSGSHAAASGHSFTDASGEFTRTTVRMFNELKAQAEKAAAEQGMSLNSFISRAVSESIRPNFRGGRKGGAHAGPHGGPPLREGSGTDRPRATDTTIRGHVQG